MRRLAIFWLACAAIGFIAAIGAAFALSLALDGGAWRTGPTDAARRVTGVDHGGLAAPQSPRPARAAPIDNESR